MSLFLVFFARVGCAGSYSGVGISCPHRKLNFGCFLIWLVGSFGFQSRAVLNPVFGRVKNNRRIRIGLKFVEIKIISLSSIRRNSSAVNKARACSFLPVLRVTFLSKKPPLSEKLSVFET
jgi:hypothetical protein